MFFAKYANKQQEDGIGHNGPENIVRMVTPASGKSDKHTAAGFLTANFRKHLIENQCNRRQEHQRICKAAFKASFFHQKIQTIHRCQTGSKDLEERRLKNQAAAGHRHQYSIQVHPFQLSSANKSNIRVFHLIDIYKQEEADKCKELHAAVCGIMPCIKRTRTQIIAFAPQIQRTKKTDKQYDQTFCSFRCIPSQHTSGDHVHRSSGHNKEHSHGACRAMGLWYTTDSG